MSIFNNLRPPDTIKLSNLRATDSKKEKEYPVIMTKKKASMILSRLSDQRQVHDPGMTPIDLDRLDNVMRPNMMQSAEVKRIIELPVAEDMTKEEIEYFSYKTINVGYFNQGFRLLKPQAQALFAYQMIDGGFLPIGVGCGKTGISLMIPELAYQKGLKKMLLIIPPTMVDQLTKIDIDFWRRRVSISYPIHVLAGRPKHQRLSIAKSGRPGLYIIPYSLLSTQDTWEVLEGIDPDIVIADEAHALASYNSARAKRFRVMMDHRQREFIPLSGTITNKSVMDYWYLARYALGVNNFLPNSNTMAKEWGSMIDAEATKDDKETSHYKPGILSPLLNWARSQNDPEAIIRDGVAGFRKAYSMRMASTRGVVTTGDDIVKCSLIIENRPVLNHTQVPGWDKVEKYGKMVDEAWKTPNGDEIEHAMQTWKWKYQIYGAGFYTELVWPDAEYIAEKLRLDANQADAFLEKAQKFHMMHNEYHKDLRRWILYRSRSGLDTPKLIGNSMHHHGPKHVGQELYDSWRAWKDTDFQGRKQIVNSNTDMYGRKSNCVRLCAFKILDMIDWIRKIVKDDGCVIWVHNIEVGIWAVEMMRAAGVEEVMYCPAGDKYNYEIIKPENSHKKIVASIKAHGEGKNLQHFQHNYYLQHTRPAKKMEQLLGRSHRNGQKADELIVTTANVTEFDHINFAATLNDSLYIHQTTNTYQRMIVAQYNPNPKIFPSEVLKEKTGDARILTREQRQILKDKFGEK